MSELTSDSASAAPQGQANEQATESPGSERGAPASPDKQNLFESEDFRRVQHNWQQKQDQLNQQLQQTEQRLAEFEERGLDDYEKVQLHNRRLAQALQQRDQHIQGLERNQQVQAQIDADLQFISGKFDVPIHELRNAETYDEAMDLAKVKFEERVAAKYKPQEEPEEEPTPRPQKHKPFLGESKPTKAASKIDRKIDEAETTVDLMRLWYDTGE